MRAFFYVYVLVSQENKPFTTPAQRATSINASGNTAGAHARTLLSTGRGELKLQSRSNLKARREHLKNI